MYFIVQCTRKRLKDMIPVSSVGLVETALYTQYMYFTVVMLRNFNLLKKRESACTTYYVFVSALGLF